MEPFTSSLLLSKHLSCSAPGFTWLPSSPGASEITCLVNAVTKEPRANMLPYFTGHLCFNTKLKRISLHSLKCPSSCLSFLLFPPSWLLGHVWQRFPSVWQFWKMNCHGPHWMPLYWCVRNGYNLKQWLCRCKWNWEYSKNVTHSSLHRHPHF